MFFGLLVAVIAPLWAAGAGIQCSAPIYDFGAVDGEAPIQHTFELRNDGSAAVEIKKTHTPCGCTVVRLTERVIPAGGTLGIPVTLTLKGRRGIQQKSVTVETNDPVTPTLVLTLRGTVGPAMEIQPPILVARKNKAGEVSGNVTLTVPGGVPFQILEVKSVRGLLTLAITEAEGNAAGRRIEARAEATLSPGQHQDTILVRTDQPAAKPIEIQALVVVPADLVVVPAVLSLTTNDTALASRTVIVKSSNADHFSIDKVDLPEKAMTARVEPMGRSAFRITIGAIRPSNSLHQKAIHIHTGGDAPRVLDVLFDVPSPEPNPATAP